MAEALVFGDSHVASVAPALQELLKDVPGATVSFVCAPGPVSGLLALSGESLALGPAPETWRHAYVSDKSLNEWYRQTSEQVRAISPDGTIAFSRFDRVVCMGGHLTARWASLHDVLSAPGFSAACRFRACSDAYWSTRHMQWLRAIAKCSAPVYSVPEPLTNEASPALDALSGKKYTFVEDVLQRLLANAGGSYVRMPAELLSADENATASRFRMDRQGDFTHVNDTGALVMARHMLREIFHIAGPRAGVAA